MDVLPLQWHKIIIKDNLWIKEQSIHSLIVYDVIYLNLFCISKLFKNKLNKFHNYLKLCNE